LRLWNGRMRWMTCRRTLLVLGLVRALQSTALTLWSNGRTFSQMTTHLIQNPGRTITEMKMPNLLLPNFKPFLLVLHVVRMCSLPLPPLACWMKLKTGELPRLPLPQQQRQENASFSSKTFPTSFTQTLEHSSMTLSRRFSILAPIATLTLFRWS